MGQLINGVWLIHPENGVHRVPADPAVIAPFVGRGWVETDLPPELDSDDPEFIELLEKLQNQAKAKSAAKPKKEAE